MKIARLPLPLPVPLAFHRLSARVKWAAVGLASVALLAACGGGGAPSSNGTLRLALTDAPACGYDSVFVTVEKVRVHKSAGAGDGDAGWVDLTLNPARRIDLLTLQNGTLEELGQVPLETGRYTQMRLVLAANNGTTPLANAVRPTGGSETALDTPSGLQSGLKMNVDIEVAADQMADAVIDFDACRSVVTAGRSGRYNLKPVLAVTPRLLSGVRGSVEASIATTASLSLQSAGQVVKATAPEAATGVFRLAPVPPGTYDLVLTAPGRATAVVTSVTVSAETVTAISNAPLALPASPTGTLAGQVTITPAAALIDASVRVQQPLLPGGSTVTVAERNVDADTGNYSLTLPTAAPQRAAFSSSGAALSFAAAASSAGGYQVSARAGSTFKGPVSVTLSPGATVTQGFAFP